MNYRSFLGKEGRRLILPYAGRQKVTDGKQTWRVKGDLSPAWYCFEIEGRFAIKIEKADTQWEEWNRPSLRGYFAGGKIQLMDAMAEVHGRPDEEGRRFEPVIVREWFDGSLWFEGFDFEDEVEEQVREAFEEERGIAGVKGVTPPLAQAFLLESTQRALEKEEARRLEAEREGRRQAEEILRRQRSIEKRLAVALSHSGAVLLDWRRNGRNEAIVNYRLGARRYECVVDLNSLRILDAGICLEGTDRELNLSSLPSAVREAVETGQLYVMR